MGNQSKKRREAREIARDVRSLSSDPDAVVRASADAADNLVGDTIDRARTAELVLDLARRALGAADELRLRYERVLPHDGRPACRSGCAWCCYLQVVVTPPEVLLVADHLRTTLSSAELYVVRQRDQRAQFIGLLLCATRKLLKSIVG